MTRGLLILIVLLYTATAAAVMDTSAVTPWPGVTAWGGEVHFGFVAPHRDIMKHLIRGHATGISVSAEWPAGRGTGWARHYGLPATGVELSVYDFGNRPQLGLGFMPLFYIRLPLNNPRPMLPDSEATVLLPDRTVRHELRLGLGVGILTRTYGLSDNPKNFAASAPFNAGLMMAYTVGIPAGRKSIVTAGLRLGHWSNGAIKVPNLGINLVAVSVGLRRHQGPLPSRAPRLRGRASDLRWQHTTMTGFGLKEIFPPGGPKYGTLTLSQHSEYHLSRKVSLGLCADLFYVSSNRVLMHTLSGTRPTAPQTIQAGLAGSWALRLGRMDVLFMMGGYVLDRYKSNGDVYTRYGVRRLMGRRLTASLMLKTHAAKADHFEAGVGWRW